jgi:hypothetical protein
MKILGKQYKTVKVGNDVIDKLNEILYQYRKIGANYDQMIKHIIKAFGEEKGKQLLSRVMQNMIDLVQITNNMVEPVVRKLEKEYERSHPRHKKHGRATSTASGEIDALRRQ